MLEEKNYNGVYARNGSVLNPPLDRTKAGYDSRLPRARYDPQLFEKLPIDIQPGDSLVSSISIPTAELKRFNVHQPVLKVRAVLTCVSQPLPPDTFRPSYSDLNQKFFLARNIKREKLYRLPLPSSAPKIKNWIRRLQMPWIDILNWNFDGAQQSQPMYGRYYTYTTSTVSLMLMLDYPERMKEALLVNYLQYAIDLWGTIRAGYSGWFGHGGYGGGRKWAIIFAGILFDDEEMRHIKKLRPDLDWGEDNQTKFGKSWTGADVIFCSHPKKMKVWFDSVDPIEWTNQGWMSESYRRCCTSLEWPGQALVIRMMKAEKLWAHDPFFAYVERWMSQDPIKLAIRLRDTSKKVGREFKNKWWLTRSETTDKFQQAMWDRYWEKLPK
jgi:hypothetical protein